MKLTEKAIRELQIPAGKDEAQLFDPDQALEKRLTARRLALGKPMMKPWVVHDLRRSVVTRLVDNRVRKRKDDPSKTETYRFAMPHTVEMLVNHQFGHKAQVAGTYNKADYLEERREAVELWAAHLLAKVEAALTPHQRNKPEKPEEVSSQTVSGTEACSWPTMVDMAGVITGPPTIFDLAVHQHVKAEMRISGGAIDMKLSGRSQLDS